MFSYFSTGFKRFIAIGVSMKIRKYYMQSKMNPQRYETHYVFVFDILKPYVMYVSH